MTPGDVAIVTLTTDFGTRDTYVAEMKAALLAIVRTVQLVDITHEIEPQDVLAGALALESAAGRFPPGTVHVAVVDPGVGTPRRGLVLAAGGHRFVGPDNGLFTPFLAGGRWTAFELRAAEYRAAEVSATFHGRDVFAPAAAHLIRGVRPESFGPAVDDPVRLPWPGVRSVPAGLEGTVVHVDRFGNLVTSIGVEALERLGPIRAVRIGRRGLPMVATYGDLRRGAVGALVGSHGRVEIAARDGSAARALGARRGARVVVSRTTTRRTRSTRSTTRRSTR